MSYCKVQLFNIAELLAKRLLNFGGNDNSAIGRAEWQGQSGSDMRE